MAENNYPKLHNAMWPGIVGKGSGDGEPIIPLDTLLTLTRDARGPNGEKFDGVDLFITAPHFDIDSDKGAVRKMVDHIASFGLKVGSFVAPIWGGAGGGSAMGDADDRKRFVTQVRKASAIGEQMREMGIRPTGGIRVDSSVGVEAWDKDPKGNTKKIAETFREAAKAAQDHGEFLVAEGEICWGGMHSWRENVNLLEMVDMPGVVGYQADMAHSMLFTLGYNAEKDRLLPEGLRLEGPLAARRRLQQGRRRASALDLRFPRRAERRHGLRLGRPCKDRPPLPGRPTRTASSISPKHAGYWLRDDKGELTKRMRHICWDGCMFPNAVMEKQETWNKVLGAMLKVRDAHGWRE